MRRICLITMAVLLAAALFALHAAAAEPKKDKPLLPQAPEKYVKLPNPATDAEAYKIGERIYVTKCARCHEADDDGERRGPDLNTVEVKTAAPGALYWVLEKGSGDMPSFAKYPDKYRWQVVTYLQSRK
ncbi:MAG TPA: cytochrome c [Terriglobales bacterium]|nr:cytochrome c [Terriglobales bacterium]